ncbi:energy transducer TonB [Longibacter sp.]|uniref:energy transducer TonB n=1 Tax=Longibacter sp. TaxID=2045415 RepID=UPI003EC11D46
MSFCRGWRLLGVVFLLFLADLDAATGQSTPTPAMDTVVVADEAPKLVGGMRALMNEVRYPRAAKRRGIEGRVFVQFVVTTEGKPVNVEVVRGAHRHLDRAAVDAIKRVTFEPGILNGEPTNVVMSLPVTFQLGR